MKFPAFWRGCAVGRHAARCSTLAAAGDDNETGCRSLFTISPVSQSAIFFTQWDGCSGRLRQRRVEPERLLVARYRLICRSPHLLA